jgi:tricorn protease
MKKLFAWFFIGLFSMSLVTPTIQTTTNAAPLWLRYPVISPDGKTIVFAYKGDLFKISSEGGIAVPLTKSEEYECMPIFTADSKSLIYASDRNGNFDIYKIALTGGQPERLTFHSSNDYPQSISGDGKTVYFNASRQDNAQYTQFPYNALGELYAVSIDGGRERQELSIVAEDAKWNKNGTKLLFHDKKGYEDPLRKHHTSSVARDCWVFDKTANSFQQLTAFNGEDRTPIWSNNEQAVFYLSERSGSFNVWEMPIGNEAATKQLTNFTTNPVRFLSVSANNELCFAYDGEIYTMTPGSQPKKLAVELQVVDNNNTQKTEIYTDGANEMAVSPNGKEIAFIVHGEVFVVNAEGGTTKRVTNTPEEERNISFSPDGNAILYASERDGIWGIYETKKVRKEDAYFYSSTLLKEETLVKTSNESFLPKYSPDGKEIAFLENRTAVSIYTVATKTIRNVLAANRNYSYSDGDQGFNWSPDSKYLLVNFLQEGNWHEQIGLIDVTGKQPMVALTQNGFSNSGAKFQMNGKMMLWFSDRNGMKNVASHGSQSDAYGLFFTQESYDLFKMKKEDYALWKEQKETAEKEKEKEKSKETSGNKKEKKDTTAKVSPLAIEFNGIENRRARLTEHSSFLQDAFLSNDGEKVYYFTSFEDGANLWVRNFKENETKMLIKLNAGGIWSMSQDKDAKNLYGIADGRLVKLDLEKGERKDISFNAEMTIDSYAERAYLFEHIWRQTKEKFYRTDMQQVDWAKYKTIYAKFLPHINNNRDFAEMASELLGELNASHTGCFYRPQFKNADATANLGAFFDESFTGNGLKISEVIEKGPLVAASTQIKKGVIIEKIDGVTITASTNYYPLLNRKAGKVVLLSLFDPATNKRWEETVKPFANHQMGDLLYERWVKRMQKMTDELSNGQLAYMHVEGMDDGSFREFYDQVMGKYYSKKALIVDTRFNGGGWLHDDLATFLSGKQYINFVPREQKIGIEPGNKWTKPSCVLMGEGNYSDAHMFPVVYKTLGIGKLVGMPVPGTGTAVWWENLQDPSLVFGIPQVGVMTMDGKYYENNQCEPDYPIANDYQTLLKGEDAQLKKAVEILLAQ